MPPLLFFRDPDNKGAARGVQRRAKERKDEGEGGGGGSKCVKKKDAAVNNCFTHTRTIPIYRYKGSSYLS